MSLGGRPALLKKVRELFGTDSPSPSPNLKILLMGVRDAESYEQYLQESQGAPVDQEDRVIRYYERALGFWKGRDKERAIYYLGGVLYLFQEGILHALGGDPKSFVQEDPGKTWILGEAAHRMVSTAEEGDFRMLEGGSLREWLRIIKDEATLEAGALSSETGALQPAPQAYQALLRKARGVSAGLLARFIKDVGA